MRVIATTCERGGVGKTSWTLALAEVASSAGISTLVVDLDPQGNATRRLLEDAEGDLDAPFAYTGASVLDALMAKERGSAAPAVITTGGSWPKNLTLLPSPGSALVVFERENLTLHDRRLARALAGIDRHGVQLILIDTGPSLGLLTQNAMTAADLVVILASVIGSRQGVAGTSAAADLIAEEYQVETAGVVLNAVDAPASRSKAQRDAVAEWYASWGNQILAELPRSSIWSTAEREAKPLHSYLNAFGRSASARAALDIVGHAAHRLGVIADNADPQRRLQGQT